MNIDEQIYEMISEIQERIVIAETSEKDTKAILEARMMKLGAAEESLQKQDSPQLGEQIDINLDEMKVENEELFVDINDPSPVEVRLSEVTDIAASLQADLKTMVEFNKDIVELLKAAYSTSRAGLGDALS